MHVLAVPGIAASKRGGPDPAGSADDAAAGLAGRACGAEDDYAGHRHYRAYAIRSSDGRRKGYNPKNKGKKSYQPILTFLAEMREYVGGELRNGDRPTGRQIARHLEGVFAALPEGLETIYARADSGFYCAEAVEAYEKAGVKFLISARKTARLIDELKAAEWTGSPKTDAEGQCEFQYQPAGWSNAYRFVALRYEKKKKSEPAGEKPEQY